jgi:hypothetical protein
VRVQPRREGVDLGVPAREPERGRLAHRQRADAVRVAPAP